MFHLTKLFHHTVVRNDTVMFTVPGTLQYASEMLNVHK